MPTLKDIRQVAKHLGLCRLSSKCKQVVLGRILEARASENKERIKRAMQTKRYPASPDVQNFHKRAQRRRELQQLKDEVDLSLHAKVIKNLKDNPRQRVKILDSISKNLERYIDRYHKNLEPLALQIVKEGPNTLGSLDAEQDQETKEGRRMLTFHFFQSLGGGLASGSLPGFI